MIFLKVCLVVLLGISAACRIAVRILGGRDD